MAATHWSVDGRGCTARGNFFMLKFSGPIMGHHDRAARDEQAAAPRPAFPRQPHFTRIGHAARIAPPGRSVPLRIGVARVAAVLLGLIVATPTHARIMDIKWDQLPPLPPPAGHTRQAGLAGPFAGAQGDVLLVGGGANFPDRAPWEGGTKTWWRDLFVLERRRDGTAQWVSEKNFQLPRPIAYGISFSTPAGVICVGGCDGAQCYRDVFQLAWDASSRTC